MMTEAAREELAALELDAFIRGDYKEASRIADFYNIVAGV